MPTNDFRYEKDPGVNPEWVQGSQNSVEEECKIIFKDSHFKNVIQRPQEEAPYSEKKTE